jgi:uncharacterized membrane protein YgaE (UPF0421/DUF939 family)
VDSLQRPGELIDVAARRARGSLGDRVARLRRNGLTIAQASVAAGAAYFVAHEALGHPHPFFAPVAAILTLGLTFGRRGRRAGELALGVALGIGVGDLLVLAIGTGSWQLVVVVGLAMSAALLAGGGTLFVSQAAVSAVLVATLQPPASGLSGARFLDALVGGVVAMLANALAPTNPLRMVRREADPLLAELGATLDDVAVALERRDPEAAAEALSRARAIDAAIARLRDALDVGMETTRLAPPRRRARGHLQVYESAVAEIDNAVRNVRVLARGAIRALDLQENVPELAVQAIRDLGEAVRRLARHLADPESDPATRELALRAAARATAALEETGNVSATVIIGQVRSTAVDLLRSMGIDGEEALDAVREARAALDI